MKKQLLKKLFKIADYDYKKCRSATINFIDGTKYYDLLPMLDKEEDILKVINDLENGAFIVPF